MLNSLAYGSATIENELSERRVVEKASARSREGLQGSSSWLVGGGRGTSAQLLDGRGSLFQHSTYYHERRRDVLTGPLLLRRRVRRRPPR